MCEYFSLEQNSSKIITDNKNLLEDDFKAEYFFALNSAKAGTHDGVRFNIGTERKYDKLGEFGIFYAIDLSVNAFQPETAYILSLKYTYSF